jgi:arylsulfatase A-like enzyme
MKLARRYRARRIRDPRHIAALILSVALGLAACGDGASRPNVLLVLVDTLRADKLGCHGSALGLTPNIDRLAAGGALFENASAHAPWTLPAVASLLTSLHPAQHRAGGALPHFTSLDPAVATLPALFREVGYETAAVINVAFLGPEFGLTRGFEHLDIEIFENNREVRSARATTTAAIAWLAHERDRPFFLMVHYFDPHLLYDPPEPHRSRFAAEEDRSGGRFEFGTRGDIVSLRRHELALEPETIERAERLYHGEVAYTDEQIGMVLDALRDLDLEDSTLVVFTSDHGEEFLDHGGFEHGHTLYAELTRVPLILRLPGVIEPRRIAAIARHLDLAPTLCELTGIEPPAGFAGRSLLGLMRGDVGADRPVLASGNFWGPPLTSWQQGEYKLILGSEAEDAPPELYRWVEDPGERENLAPSRSDVVALLLENLGAFEARTTRPLAQGMRGVELSEETRRQLERLGYLSNAESD